jgi:hypothetical protein
MRIQKTAAAIAAITVLAMTTSTPVFAKAHNNGVNANEREIGHISGRDGSANTYLRDEAPDAKNIGEVVRTIKPGQAKQAVN